MAADHLSLYQLTIEDGTAFADRYTAGKLRGLPPDDLAADMYQTTQEICAAAGLPAYEVSNHAKPGAESRHNLIYWRYGDYVGIGPGAHGRISQHGNRYATEAFSSPAKWLTGTQSGTTEKPRTILAGPEQADEYLMMGLRIADGIDPVRYERLAGQPLSSEATMKLVDLGMITATPERICVTDQGRMLLNAVIIEFLSGI